MESRGSRGGTEEQGNTKRNWRKFQFSSQHLTNIVKCFNTQCTKAKEPPTTRGPTSGHGLLTAWDSVGSVWVLCGLQWQLLFDWDASAFVHLQAELCVRLLQEHNRRAVQLGQTVGQFDEPVRPDLEEDNASRGR